MGEFPQLNKHPINGCCYYRNGNCVFTYECEHRHKFFNMCDYQSATNKQAIKEAEKARDDMIERKELEAKEYREQREQIAALKAENEALKQGDKLDRGLLKKEIATLKKVLDDVGIWLEDDIWESVDDAVEDVNEARKVIERGRDALKGRIK